MKDVFKALADNTRREILLRLAENPANVNEIAAHFDMSRPAISRHIKILRESELISVESGEQDGRQINCYAQLEALKEVDDYMKKLESFWKSRLQGLGKYLDKKNKGLQ
ncbi:MAG: metalloregulator ArsR/SmtB family transcription factor [Bacteroidota bacterium]